MNGFQYARRTVTASGTVTVLSSDTYLSINKTVGAATSVQLPNSPRDGFLLMVKDAKGDANTNNITLLAGSGDSVEGAVINTANGFKQWVYDYDAAKWWIS